MILYQLNYHHDEVIVAGRCGLDICITVSKYDVKCSVIRLLTTQLQKALISLISLDHTVHSFAHVHLTTCVFNISTCTCTSGLSMLHTDNEWKETLE